MNQASASSERRIALVGCVKQKQRGTHAARALYRSPLFTKRRAHVERRGLPWFVLSAKYGLVEPDDAIASYDVTLNGMGVRERDAWGEGVVRALEQKLGDVRGLVFEVHAGERYVTPIEARLAARGASIDAPTRGLPMGKQLRWYGRQVSVKASRSVFIRR